MAIESFSPVLKHMTALFQTGAAGDTTDGSLLDRFRHGPAGDAEAAFAVLVDRHGPMVMHVCRRILGDCHDAEDAAQATFLVLAKQARSIRVRDSLASWLYGVALRVAAQTRRHAARRRARERRSVEAAMAIRREDVNDLDAADTVRELYEELARLPDRFRLPIVLCHLEGLSYEQAAQQLGCPVRTVHSRLSRARQRLRERLARRGLGPAVAPSVVVPKFDPVSAVVAASWKDATVQAAARYAASGATAAMVSPTVAALAEGVSRMMLLHRLMKWASLLLLIGVATSGAGMALFARSAAQEEKPSTAPDRDNHYRTTVASGATIEVVGVSSVPTGPNTWWKPDGTRLTEPPVDAIKSNAKANEGEVARVILVRATGVNHDDLFRWHPTFSHYYWGGRPMKNGQNVEGLEYYEATYPRDRADCGVQAGVAAGMWKTETSNDGKGGVGEFVNGHKYAYGKARSSTVYGRPMTVFAVAHNFFGQDRRIVAVDRDGQPHVAVGYSAGSDGDKRWVIDLIDAEFTLPLEQIREFQVQFRPIEQVEIRGIALNPR